MNAQSVLTQAKADGVQFQLSGGTARARGEPAAIERWVSLLREHKGAIRAALAAEQKLDESLEAVLKGMALCLVLDATGEKLWIVADEEDAQLLGEPLGATYTAEEVRIIARIDDPDIVGDLRAFKKLAKGHMRRPTRADKSS
jgi:hypothetical protein